MRALGLDLGTKRVGVAVCDAAGTVATPLEVLERSGSRRTDHARVAALIEEWEADAIVVGVPYSLDGSVGPSARTCLTEIGQLGDTLDVPVVPYDERLTTVTAERSLMEQQLNAKERRRVVDMVAASVILQSWIDAGMPR